MGILILACFIALVAVYIYAALFINRAKSKKAVISDLRIGQKVFVHDPDGQILELPIVALTLGDVHFDDTRVPSLPIELVFLTLESAKQIRIKVVEREVASQMKKPTPKKKSIQGISEKESTK